MAISELFAATQDIAAADGEWSLTNDSAGVGTQTTQGLVQAVIEITDLADGEELQLRAYEKARSGDTQRKVWEAIFADAQDQPLVYTPPLILMHGWDFTCDVITGTVTVNWSIRSLAATVTQRASGTHAIDTTEWSLGSDTSYDTGDAQTTDGHYQVFLDVNDMVQADILQIRAYEKCRAGDTQRLAFEDFLYGPQASKLYVSPALCGIHGWDWSLDALAGTITVLWSIRTVGS